MKLNRTRLSRRALLQAVSASAGLGWLDAAAGRASPARFGLSTFSAEITVPIGHPLMGGGIAPASQIVDPLFAHGLVLHGTDRPIVLVAADWCEIRNDAYDEWQNALAEAADTDPDRVLVMSVHQHDTPVTDLAAERLLEAANLPGRICDISFHHRAVNQVATAVRAAVADPKLVTHIGTGQAQVNRVASNRRYHAPDGSLRFDRTSASQNPIAHEAELGVIDPWLKTLSFWNEDTPLAAIHAYATHPMSYYGRGGVSSDFVGHARDRRRRDDANCHQIYVSGASGNVTAGKFNDGSAGNREVLTERIYQAMLAAWRDTKRVPLQQVELRHTPLRLEPRSSPGFTVADLRASLSSEKSGFEQCLAAMGLSWRDRADRGDSLDLPVIDFGPAQFVLLPGESYVEYQLEAQRLRPDSFVFVAGYGECATGYVPTDRAWTEEDTNLRDWCWVAPGAEAAMIAALKMALQRG